MSIYSEKQTGLKKEATKILSELNLEKILSKYGKVEIIGSYSLDLMTWRDIDIEVLGDTKYENYLECVNHLFNQDKVYNLTLQDYRKSVHADRPQGIYLGIKYLFDRSKGWKEMWKIDIWFLSNDDLSSIETREYVKSKLNEQNRELILKLKTEMRENTTHGKEISGREVYYAVLDNNVKDLESLKEYLKQQGREL
jgi:hypothetical protein